MYVAKRRSRCGGLLPLRHSSDSDDRARGSAFKERRPPSRRGTDQMGRGTAGRWRGAACARSSPTLPAGFGGKPFTEMMELARRARELHWITICSRPAARVPRGHRKPSSYAPTLCVGVSSTQSRAPSVVNAPRGRRCRQREQRRQAESTTCRAVLAYGTTLLFLGRSPGTR